MKATGCIPREMHAHVRAGVHTLRALISHLILRGPGSPEARRAHDSQMEVPVDREGRRLTFHNAGHEEEWDLKQPSFLVDHLGAGVFPNFGCPSPSDLRLPLCLPVGVQPQYSQGISEKLFFPGFSYLAPRQHDL